MRKLLRITLCVGWLFGTSGTSNAVYNEMCFVPPTDHVSPCNENVDCLNNTFNRLEREIKVGLRKGADRSRVLLRKGYDAHEEYRKAFCAAAVQHMREFWRGPAGSPEVQYQKPQLQLKAAVCNVTLLGEFHYQATIQMCVSE